MHSSSPARIPNCNLLMNSHQQENVGSHQKKILHIQRQRRSPNKMVGRAKLCLESDSIPTRDTWRVQTKPCVNQDPGTPQETDNPVSACLLRRHGSAVGCCGHRGSGGSRPGGMARGISPLGGGHHQPHHRAAEQRTHRLHNILPDPQPRDPEEPDNPQGT